MGFVVVIEGTDGSGKETQSKKLMEIFNKINLPSKLISYPNYNSRACEPVKMYYNNPLRFHNKKHYV